MSVIYPVNYQRDVVWCEVAIAHYHLQMTRNIVFDTLRLFQQQEELARQTNFEQNFNRVDIRI